MQQFFPFAVNADSNVMSQSTWEESAERAAGNVAGQQANSALVNKAIRQGTMVASAIGYYIDSRGYDALDDGDFATLAANLADAINKDITDSAAAIIQTSIDNGVVAPGNMQHNNLTGRNVSGAHNIADITNLQATLDSLNSQLSAGAVPDASTTTKGIIRLATQTEVNQGSSSTSAVTPATLKNTVFSTNQIPNLDASIIVTGTFDVARIPTLGASKIGSGTFATARIPNLDASKVTSGVFDAARIPDITVSNIPNLPASKVTSGTFAVARIPDLAASKITSGTLSTSVIPSLDASKITSGTIDAARLPTISIEWGNIGGTLSDQTDLNSMLAAKESTSNKVTSITSSSTDTQYPSAKAVYTYGQAITPAAAAWGGIGGTLSNQTDLWNALANKVTANNAITAATKCKISYDSKGLVIAGADLEASDIPSLAASKITSGTIDSARLPTPKLTTLVSGSSTTSILLYVPTSEGTYIGQGVNSSTITLSTSTWQGTIPTTAGSTGYMTLTLPSGVSSYNYAAGVGTVRIGDVVLYVTGITKSSNSQLRINLYCPTTISPAPTEGTLYLDIEYVLRGLIVA